MKMKMILALAVILIMISLPGVDALSISGVQVSELTDKSAVISWQTDVPSTGKLQYSTDKISFTDKVSTESKTNQSFFLTGLDNNTEYYFRAVATSATETFTDDSNGNFYAFKTSPADVFEPPIKVELPAFHSENRIDLVGMTEIKTEVKIFVNGPLFRNFTSIDGVIAVYDVPLDPSRNNLIRIEAKDELGNENSRDYRVAVDVVPPVINLSTTVPSLSNQSFLRLEGTVSETAQIDILLNGQEVFAQETAGFDTTINFVDGKNILLIRATDKGGLKDEKTFETVSDTETPQIEEIMPLEEGPFYYEGRAADDVSGKTEPGAKVYMYVSGIFVTGYEPAEPVFDELLKKAQYQATADENGNFRFADVDFEHPLPSLESLAPEVVSPELLPYTGTQGVAELQQNERAVKVWVVVVDKVGLTTKEFYTVSIGTCFSGFFDFTIKPLPEYQNPSLLSPDRLDTGTEMISFVLDLSYRGRAANNLDNATETITDNYYSISSVYIEPACRQDDFLERDPSYRYACQIMRGSPDVELPIDTANTKWYFRYSLGQTSAFTNYSQDFWKTLINNELKFPMKVTVNYREKLPGKTEEQKYQTICREVSYYVDIPVDPRKVLPDWLLEGGMDFANQTITRIDQVIEPLEQVINYAGIACMGGFGLRFVVQIYRRFSEAGAIAACLAEEAAARVAAAPNEPDPEKKCYIKTPQQLNKCYFVGEKSPIPLESEKEELNTLCNDPLGPGKLLSLRQSMNAKHFTSVDSVWTTEETLYQAYRALCDRVFCHAAPAGWTQQKSIPEIRQVNYEQSECSADSSSVRRIEPIDNCYETYGPGGQDVLAPGVQKSALGFKCYRLGNCLYRQKTESADDGMINLELISRLPPECATQNTLQAKKEGDFLFTSDTRNCKAVCESAGANWDGKCGTLEQLRTENAKYGDAWRPYPAGPAADCNFALYPKDQCWCWKDEGKAYDQERASIEAKGAYYAGTEKENIGESDSKLTQDQGEWPWDYRQWQIYRSTDGTAGVYYPQERYYNGRDVTAAFGMDYLLDYFSPGDKKVTEVNPFTQHVGAFQTLCLSGIRARLMTLRTMMVGFNNCLQQVKISGRADAGVCKELLTQYFCNLVYKVFDFFRGGGQCVPESFSENQKYGLEDQSITEFFQKGSASIMDTMEDTADELSSEYGNAKLNQFLEGGTQAMMKKICLASFGIDVGFDFNEFIDAAYSVPFKTSVAVVSSEGMVGRREFLSFNPTNLNSIYEYRTAWTIFPGCELESYTIDLVAVTEKERRDFENVNCLAVDNREPDSNGCDNLRGSSEITHPFFSGGRVQQGVYVDQNKMMSLEDVYRYDHIKVTLNLAPDWDAEKCFPAENKVGNSGVFYFPIKDKTPRDILECEVSVTDGRFMCTAFSLESLGQGWFEDVDCWNDATKAWENCQNMVFAVNDSIKLRSEVFSSGNKLCLQSYARTANSGNQPVTNTLWPVIGLGRPNTIPVEMNLIDKITQEIFEGDAARRVFAVAPDKNKVDCEILIEPVNDQGEKKSGTVKFSFEKVGADTPVKLKVKVEGNLSFVNPDMYNLVNNYIASIGNGKNNFTEAELKNIQMRVNGYGFKFDKINFIGNGYCQVQSYSQTTALDQPQNWDLFLSLYLPNQNQQCIEGSMRKVSLGRGIAYETEKTIPIKVQLKKAMSAEDQAYERGLGYYNTGKFLEARNSFKIVIASGKDKTLVHAYWWYIASLVELASNPKYSEVDKKAFWSEAYIASQNFRVFYNGQTFTYEGKTPPEIVYPEDYKLIKEYIGKLEPILAEKSR